jgi:hypothetical protein
MDCGEILLQICPEHARRALRGPEGKPPWHGALLVADAGEPRCGAGRGCKWVNEHHFEPDARCRIGLTYGMCDTSMHGRSG